MTDNFVYAAHEPDASEQVARGSSATPEGASAIDALFEGIEPQGVAPEHSRVPASGQLQDSSLAPTLAPALTPGPAPTRVPALTARPAPTSGGPSPRGSRSATSAVDSSGRWLLWWIPTLLLPLMGGLGAWFVLREKRVLAARAMLTVGIVIGMFASVAFLHYAEDLGTRAADRSARTVIVLPSAAPVPGRGSGGSGAGSSGTGSDSSAGSNGNAGF